MHRTTRRFWRSFEKLPEPVQRIAQKKFHLPKADPTHPSLHFKKVGNLWSVRIGLDYRALAVEDREDFIWTWIGTHDEYLKLAKDQR